MARVRYTDDVRGIVIGGFTYPYEFWRDTHPQQRFARGHFENDQEAEAWVAAHYPDEYARGVEMRCFE